ncbi:hypothetical protein MMC26_001451 [Xylographa opegraphella]|nr:hypothetical protein [Xylographa opegraphella]
MYRDLVITETTLDRPFATGDLRTFFRLSGPFQPDGSRVKNLWLKWQFSGDQGSYHTSEQLVGILVMALPKFPMLKTIKHSGTIYQDSLECVSEAKSIQNLLLRIGDSSEHCFEWETDDRGPVLVEKSAALLVLDFSVLEKLLRLRSLTMQNLLLGEGAGLGEALRTLPKLEHLNVTAARKTHAYYMEDEEETRFGITPFDDILQTVYPDGETGDLLPALKSLTLIDKYSGKIELNSSFFASQVKAFPILESLHFNVKCVYHAKYLSLAEVLRAWLTPSIKKLQVPIYEALDYRPDIHTWRRTRDQERAALIEVLAPFRDTIQQWIIPTWAAYRSFNQYPKELDILWEGEPSYRQICTGDAERASDRGPVKDTYPTSYLFDETLVPETVDLATGVTNGSCRMASSWGRDVQHMLAPYIDLRSLIVDTIHPNDSSFHDLRVLIISPDSISNPSKDEKLESRLEYRIAQRISDSHLPCLRIVVVGAYKFWFEFPETDAEEQCRVWDLQEATDDVHQRETMARCLSKEDWVFVTPPFGSEARSYKRNITTKKIEAGDNWTGDVSASDLGMRVIEEKEEDEDWGDYEVDEDGDLIV